MDRTGFEDRYWGDMAAEMTTAPAYGTMRAVRGRVCSRAPVQDSAAGRRMFLRV